MKIILLITIALYSIQINGQSFIHFESQILPLAQEALTTEDEKRIINLHDSISGYFLQALQTEGSFEYGFDTLKFIGKLSSPDKNLRVYTWNAPLKNGNHKYYGFLQYKNPESKNLEIAILNDSTSLDEPYVGALLSPKSWYGALYYDIIEVKKGKEKYYTLLGFDFNNLFSNKKVVESLGFDMGGKPVFGQKVFVDGNKLKNRVVFEYSARVQMVLRYQPEQKRIVFDHLSPIKPSLTGDFQFYGPDFSYDAYNLEDGLWVFEKDVDVRN